MDYVVYILQCGNGRFYVGQTTNLEDRILRHQTPDGGWYTRSAQPIRLVYSERFVTHMEAYRREQQLKGWSHAKKQALIDGDLPKLKMLSRSCESMPS